MYSAYQWPGAQVIEWFSWPCHSSNFAPEVPKLRLASLSPSLDQEPPLHHIVHLLIVVSDECIASPLAALCNDRIKM